MDHPEAITETLRPIGVRERLRETVREVEILGPRGEGVEAELLNFFQSGRFSSMP